MAQAERAPRDSCSGQSRQAVESRPVVGIDERYSFWRYEKQGGETIAAFGENWGLAGLKVTFTRVRLEERLRNLQYFGHRHDLTERVLAEWPKG
jgi:hypothetical protein